MKKILLILFAALLLSTPAVAEEKKAPAPPVPVPAPVTVPAPVAAPAPVVPAPVAEKVAVPDTSNMLFIQNLRKAGATIYYLGDALNMHGWFAVKDNQVQIFYTSMDSRALLVGALLSPEGANISQQQVELFAQSHPELLAVLKAASNQEPTPPAGADKSIPPSEAFYGELLKANHIAFEKPSAKPGQAAESPLVLMVMDVNCHYCHQTWAKLQQPVEEGKLRLWMIPVAALGAQSATQGAVWIGKPNPQDVWKKYVGGDTKALDGAPDAQKEAAIAANTALLARWKVDQTPYILYHGKNGKVRLVVGEPQDANTILNDLGG